MKIRLSDEDRALLWLNITLGSGTARVRKMLDAFDGSAAEAFRAAAKNEIPQFKFLNDERREDMHNHATQRYIDRIEKRLEELDINVATINSDCYPVLLKNIYDPPYVLFYKGTLYAEHRLPIAIIGAREPSDYGRRMARQLAEDLARSGACIVSGLAYGLDRVAAEGALDA